jgi:hypothetical protein
MKGVIPDCLTKLVVSKFGKDKWKQCLEDAKLPANSSFLATADIPDADVLKLVNSVCKVLNLSLDQAADAFGDFWVNEYAVKIYRPYFKGKSARELLLNMDKVHQTVTQNIANAHPPRFEYDWKDDQTLIMTYKSNRNLIDFLVGVIKGVGKYYKENLKVMKLGKDKVQIRFPS